jgi:hypothetical protein
MEVPPELRYGLLQLYAEAARDAIGYESALASVHRHELVVASESRGRRTHSMQITEQCLSLKSELCA